MNFNYNTLPSRATFLDSDDDDEALLVVMASTAAACLLFSAAIEKEKEEKTQSNKRVCVKEHRKRRRRLCNTQRRRLCNTQSLDPLKPDSKDVKNFIRMDEESFNFVLSAIRPDIERQNIIMMKAFNPEEKLLVALRFLATGEICIELENNSQLSQSFLETAILDVCEAIYERLKNQFLKFPTSKEEWLKIADDYSVKWQFPHCLGALDGKHIAFRPEDKGTPQFYNYNGFHSVVLLGLADAYGKFIFIDVLPTSIKINGQISDAEVLQRSDVHKILQQPDKYLPPKQMIGNSRMMPYMFIGDNAFPLSENMMVPYSFTTVEEPKVIFNQRLSRARQSIERAFDVLSNRFQIFQKPINLHQDKVIKIVQCCCVLHNFLTSRSQWYREQNKSDSITTSQQQSTTMGMLDSRLKSNSGETIRKQLTEYFNDEGLIEM